MQEKTEFWSRGIPPQTFFYSPPWGGGQESYLSLCSSPATGLLANSDKNAVLKSFIIKNKSMQMQMMPYKTRPNNTDTHTKESHTHTLTHPIFGKFVTFLQN